MGLFEKLRSGLAKTRDSIVAKMSQLVSGKNRFAEFGVVDGHEVGDLLFCRIIGA